MEMIAELTQTIWPFMADFLLQSTVLLGVAQTAHVLCGRLSSARRHALLLTGMLGIPVLLLIVIATPLRWQLPEFGGRSKASARAETVITPIPLSREATLSVAPPFAAQLIEKDSAPAQPEHATVAPPAPRATTATSSTLHWTAFVAVVWLAGILFSVSRLVIGWLSLQMAARQFRSLDDGAVRGVFDAIGADDPRLQGTNLLESPGASMPMTFRIRKPAVVMPVGAALWHPDRTRRVLLHELAHVARRDCLTNTLALVSGCLLWFHPLAWSAWLLLRREQESAADDWAIQRSRDAEAYADDLVAMVREYSGHLQGIGFALSIAIAMARGRHSLKRRLDVILDNRRDRSSCGGKLILATLPVWMACVIGLGGMVACRDKAEPIEGAPAHQQTHADSRDTRFSISTMTFKAPPEMDLEQLLNMKNRIQADGSLWAGALTDSAGEELFESLRSRDDLQFVQIPALTTRAGQRAKFENIQEFIYPTEYDPPELPRAAGGSDNGRAAEQQAEIVRLEMLVDLSDDRLIEEAPDLGIKNAAINTLFPRSLELKAELASLVSKTSSEHPDVLAIQAELRQIDRVLVDGVAAARATMATQLAILRKTAASPPTPAAITSIIPSIPTGFETRNTGTIFEFLPVMLPDGRIDLEFALEHVRFLGFVDYGTPIVLNWVTGMESTSQPFEQANKIQQPIISTSKITSSTTMDNGSWIVVAGLGKMDIGGAPASEKMFPDQFEKTDNFGDSQLVVLIRVSTQ